MRFTRLRRGERGATLVEMAFVLPIFLVLIFGIIELGTAFRERLIVDDAVQTAGRIGTAVGNDVDSDIVMLDTIRDEVVAMANQGIGTVKYVDIYRVGANGLPTADLNRYAYTYTVDPTTCDWTPCPQGSAPVNYSGWTWSPSARHVESGNLDTIGIKVYFSHYWITGLLPFSDKVCSNADLAGTCWVEETILRLEPLKFSVGA